MQGISDTFDKLISKDYQIIRLPGTYMFGASLIPDEDEMVQHPVKYGIAADPDEYIVEINEEPNPFTPQEKVVLCVLDVEESTDFYTKVLGFDLVRKRYNLNNRPRAASCTVYLVSALNLCNVTLKVICFIQREIRNLQRDLNLSFNIDTQQRSLNMVLDLKRFKAEYLSCKFNNLIL